MNFFLYPVPTDRQTTGRKKKRDTIINCFLPFNNGWCSEEWQERIRPESGGVHDQLFNVDERIMGISSGSGDINNI
jgi:hypothetical protein